MGGGETKKITYNWVRGLTYYNFIYMRPEGYGQVLLGRVRQAKKMSLFRPVEFPLTLGRDFTGEVVAKGSGVTDDLNVGDIVMGVAAPFQQGCHAQFVSVPDAQVNLK